MGRKSKRGHNKYRTATITRKEERRLETVTIPRPQDNLSPVTTPVISKQKPAVGITATTISDIEKYAYVKTELKIVGILTALILVILIISALLLR